MSDDTAPSQKYGGQNGREELHVPESHGDGDENKAPAREVVRRPQAQYAARLLMLAAAYAVAYLLFRLSDSPLALGSLILAGVILIALGILFEPWLPAEAGRFVLPLFDLAWMTLAMNLIEEPAKWIVPALYGIIAGATTRTDHWELSTSIGGAFVAIWLLSTVRLNGPAFNLALAQTTLLAAATLALRLTAVQFRRAKSKTGAEALYAALVARTTQAVFTLEPQTWRILEANPAALALTQRKTEELIGQPLTEILGLAPSFIKACQASLACGEAVFSAIVEARGPDGVPQRLRCHLTSICQDAGETILQAIVEPLSEAEPAPRSQGPPRREDVCLLYLPSLTHELNNQLAAIRMTAELAATTGKPPNLEEIQRQVDRAQAVLQTVVMQILGTTGSQPTADQPLQTDLRLALERVLLIVRPHILRHRIELQTNLPSVLPAVVGAAFDIQEALVRLILKAAEKMGSQEGPRILQISANPRDKDVELVLVNSGPGLSARELAVLNGRRVDVSRAEDRPWELIRDGLCRFGGSLQADNGPDGGMRVRIALPRVSPTSGATEGGADEHPT